MAETSCTKTLHIKQYDQSEIANDTMGLEYTLSINGDNADSMANIVDEFAKETKDNLNELNTEVIKNVKVNGQIVSKSNNSVDIKIDIPTRTSELVNDSNFINSQHNHQYLTDGINYVVMPNKSGTVGLLSDIQSLKDDINNLSEKVNVNKIYTTFAQINASADVTTDIVTLFGWMESNSIAILEISYMDNNVYPSGFGTCIIYKNSANKNGIEYIDTQTGESYVGSCHVNFASGFSGWRKLATSITSTLTLLNGWAVYATDDDLIVSRSGDLVNIHGVIKKDSSITIGEDIAILPDIYIPTILRRSVVIDVNSNTLVGIDVNTDGSIKWYGGALDSISQIRIDITYTV